MEQMSGQWSDSSTALASREADRHVQFDGHQKPPLLLLDDASEERKAQRHE